MMYISSACSDKKRADDALLDLVRLGFKDIELTAHPVFYEHVLEDVFSLRDQYNLNLLIHNYFPPVQGEFVLNIGSRDPEIKEKSLELVVKAVELSRAFGKDLYSLHPGFESDLLPELEGRYFIRKNNCCTNYRSDFYEAVKYVAERIIPRGFKVAVENLCPKSKNEKYSFLSDLCDIESFLNYFQEKDNVGLLLDLGHFDAASIILGFDKFKMLDDLLNRYYNRIFEIHVSENDGANDCHGVSPISSWQIDFLKGNRKLCSLVPIVFEWQKAANKATYEQFLSIAEVLADEKLTNLR